MIKLSRRSGRPRSGRRSRCNHFEQYHSTGCPSLSCPNLLAFSPTSAASRILAVITGVPFASLLLLASAEMLEVLDHRPVSCEPMIKVTDDPPGSLPGWDRNAS